MATWRFGCALLVLCWSFTSSFAESTNTWQSVVRHQSGQAEKVQSLTARQIELVRRVNAYFNQLTMLRGSFVQTSSDGKRQRGKFHLLRPGRFRFDFAPPSRVVIISDGKYLAVQDHDLRTDDRRDLNHTPFVALLRADVDLQRDAVISEVGETDDAIMIRFSDVKAEMGTIKLFLSLKPTVQLKGWIVRDNQNVDTRIDLVDMQAVSNIDPRLFDPATRLELRQ